ncbi:hypothetical protein D3C80_2083920 [compost metagenome]
MQQVQVADAALVARDMQLVREHHQIIAVQAVQGVPARSLVGHQPFARGVIQVLFFQLE